MKWEGEEEASFPDRDDDLDNRYYNEASQGETSG